MNEMRGIGDTSKFGSAIPRRAALRLLSALGLASGIVQGETTITEAATASGLQKATLRRPDLPGAYFQGQGDAMEPMVTHLNPEGMHAHPAFSQAVAVAGNVKTIYIGGQNAVDADGQVVGSGDVAAQTEQVFVNLETVLTAAGATLHDIVKWTIYVVQGQDFSPGFEVFQRRWGTSAMPPAISGVLVAGLANPEYLVEIEAIAVVGMERSSD